MPAAHLRRRFRYHAWASALLADTLVEASAPAEPARAALAHAVAADRVWLLRLRDEPSEGVALWPALEAEGIARLARLNAQGYADLLSLMRATDLGQPAAYRSSRGEQHQTPWADILEHVLLHGAYHRGQAACALREAGTTPPSTDFIAWVRAGEPDAPTQA